MIKEFYGPFAENLERKYKEVATQKVAVETTDKPCPECLASPDPAKRDNHLVVRFGRYGKFYACSGFPECKYTESLLQVAPLNILCPKCGKGKLTAKYTKRKKIFYGCNRYPECDYALWDKPNGQTCEKCGSLMVETLRKIVKCSNRDCETNKQ